jgi:hypothetical protein
LIDVGESNVGPVQLSYREYISLQGYFGLPVNPSSPADNHRAVETIRRILVALALPLAIAACSGTNLPTHRDWGGASPLAPAAGRLVLSGDCVSLVDSRTGGSWLVVWPPGTSRNGADIVGSGGNPLAQIGDEVTLVGGEYQADVVGSQLTAPIPSECQTDLYWLVGDLTVDGSPAASP